MHAHTQIEIQKKSVKSLKIKSTSSKIETPRALITKMQQNLEQSQEPVPGLQRSSSNCSNPYFNISNKGVLDLKTQLNSKKMSNIQVISKSSI